MPKEKKQNNERVCKYPNCKHGGKINLSTDDYERVKSSSYYHKDCYQEKCDLQLFRELWSKNISSTVVYSMLNRILNEYLQKGVSSDYLLFALQYVILHKYNLNYPAGFRYYIDMPEIKDEYKRSRSKKIKQSDFKVESQSIIEEVMPFTFNVKKSGFQDIFGSKKENKV